MASFSVTNAFAFAHANQVCCLLLDRLLLKGRGILFRLLLKDLQRSVCSCCLFLFHAMCLFLTFFCINAFLVALIYECKWSIQSDFVCVVIVTCFLSYSCYFFCLASFDMQCSMWALCAVLGRMCCALFWCSRADCGPSVPCWLIRWTIGMQWPYAEYMALLIFLWRLHATLGGERLPMLCDMSQASSPVIDLIRLCECSIWKSTNS